MRRLREHLNYANVMATTATFLALGGTSYAVVSLPPNSVGQRQLKPNSVGSSELRSGVVRSKDIHNGSVTSRDISSAAKRALRGQQGPQGPPGTPAATLSVAVTAAGEAISGNGTAGQTPAGRGVYEVKFGRNADGSERNMTGCRAVATLSRAAKDGSMPELAPNGEITTDPTTTGVTVRTFNSQGQLTNLPFHLLVIC
jgi:hypothetical protein